MSEIRSTRVTTGLNIDNEPVYVRCAKCGFMCKPERDVSATEGTTLGYGIRLVATTTGTAAAQPTSWGDSEWGDSQWDTGVGQESTLRTFYDPVVYAGCPMCGTFLYNK